MGIESVRGGGLLMAECGVLFTAGCGVGSGLEGPFTWRRLRVLDLRKSGFDENWMRSLFIWKY